MTILKKTVLIFFITFGILLMATMSNATTKGTMIADEVRLRRQANDTSTVLELIEEGKEVEVLEQAEEWTKIKYNKITGYVKTEHIKVEENSNRDQTNSTKEETSNQATESSKQEDSSQKEEIGIGKKVKIVEGKSIYSLPLMHSLTMATTKESQEFTVIQIVGQWIYLNGEQNGWIRKQQIQVSKEENPKQEPEGTTKPQEQVTKGKIGYIITEGINFRKEPNANSDIIKVFIQNAKITILDETDSKWYKIKNGDNIGYVLKDYVSEKKVEVTSRSSETRNIPNTVTQMQETSKTQREESIIQKNSKGEEVVAYAKQFLGKAYVYGGETPQRGFDCSGFTKYVYKKFGKSLPHSATSQSKLGTKVAKSDLQLGDLVFFSDYKTYQGIGHCGIYVGNNNFIHASTEKTGVIISSLLKGSYVKRYVCAVRILL